VVASYQQVKPVKRSRDDDDEGVTVEDALARRRAKRDPLKKAFRVFDVEHVPAAATAAAAPAVKEAPNPLAGCALSPRRPAYAMHCGVQR
jgi:hypothetical protein